MSKLQYLLHSIETNLEQNNNKIDEEIFTQLKKAFKLARLKYYLSHLNNDENILKYSGKKLFNYITTHNIELKKEDFEKILSYSTRETTHTKVLKGFNKSKLSDDEQNEMINKYNEFNPYEEEFTPYLKSKGKTEGIKLQDHQRKFIEAFFYANLRGAIAFWGVGTGKTLGAVASMKLYLALYPSHKIFIISPPALLGNMANSMLDYGIDIRDKRITFYTYDEYYKHGIDAHNCFVIIDEAHNFRTDFEIKQVLSGDGSRETKAHVLKNKKGYAILTKAGIPCHKILLLTGTPFVNGLYDIENLISFAEGKEPISKESFGNICSDENTRYDYFKYRISHYVDNGQNANFPKINYIYQPLIIKNPDHIHTLQQFATPKRNPFYSTSRALTETLDDLKIDFIINKIKENPDYKTIIYSNYLIN